MNKLDSLKPIYFPSECDIDGDLFLPVAEKASSLDCMVGYFTSGSFEELARSMACYLSSCPSAKLRFIASPNLSDHDLVAIKDALNTDKNLVPLLFPEFSITENSLKSNAIKALCYLISSGKMELKIAIQDEGLFHTKCWLFHTDYGNVAIHGSGNATKSALIKNFEQLAVARSWLSDESKEVFGELRARFDTFWANEYSGILCAELNNNTIDAIRDINRANENVIDKDDWSISIEIKEKLIRGLESLEEESGSGGIQKLKVPSWLNYQTGEFGHQGRAVKAWFDNESQGILSIATGGGKTLTALVSASLLSQNLNALFVVISVPTTALVNQWQLDVESFSVDPITTLGSSPQQVKRRLKQAGRNLRLGLSKVEVMLIINDSLKGNYAADLKKISETVPSLLIGDEVHNLGSEGFKNSPPDFFKYRLGLSATYEREFDDEGNSFLLSFFGKVVFEYNLEEAIGSCLVPYEYHAHEVSLTAEEEDDFLDLTYKIKKISYAIGFSDGDHTKERLKSLFLKRRKIIESASLKVAVFDRIFPKDKEKAKRTLVFCTDKYPEQLSEVNAALNSRCLEFHQITKEETKNSKRLKALVKSFSDDTLQVLTSKRVLDEGFNVPQTETAYLLASRTGKRQWIQRLGRILRLSPETGKKKAVLHDFIVIPPGIEGDFDDDFKSMVQAEYNRVKFFTQLSLNGLEKGGSIYLTNKLLDLMRKK